MADRTVDPREVDAILAREGRERKDLVAVLRGVQERWGHLPEAALRRIPEESAITAADIEGVSTFYDAFRRKPAGRHRVRVCIGTACFVKGGETVYDAFRSVLKIPIGADTDAEGLFSVEKAACLGCCTLAPVVQIDGVVYGHCSRSGVPSVLRDFLTAHAGAEGDAEGPAGPAAADRGAVALCTCTSCRASGAQEVLDAFRGEVKAFRLEVSVRRSACSGASFRAPVVDVFPRAREPVRYTDVAPRQAREILFRHFRAPTVGRGARRAASLLLDRLLAADGGVPVEGTSLDLARGPDGAFWSPQVRIVTEDNGRADPLDLDGYRAGGGFGALRQCLETMDPRAVVDAVRRSGLRGRGGAGYPTGKKWADVRDAPGGTKHLLCNADEGDPGAFMDRMILESFPFRVIEGMAIAAYAVGAETGLFYVRTEYPLAIRRIRRALEICNDEGILGERVLGYPLRLSLEVSEGAGAFVCGEETAMIAALEGGRGNPSARPPYPSLRGLWGRPTLVNNVETLAAVPWIVLHGADAFRAVGTPSSPGTKTFALAGRIRRGGLVEVPMGMSIRSIVEEIGGGIQDGKRFKAVQIGGPSGGCLPETLADLPVDYESLSAAGAMMGSGGMVVLDESDCMVDIARYFMAFTQHESCGKCTFCRVGTRRMLDVLTRLCEGGGRPGDVERLTGLALAVRVGSLCGLGRSAPNPVLTTLRHFRAEYDAHAAGRCPAGRCRALISYFITEDCIGCTRCAQNCPAEAIPMRPYERHRIDGARCIRCGTCRQVCPSHAVRTVPRAASAAGEAAGA